MGPVALCVIPPCASRRATVPMRTGATSTEGAAWAISGRTASGDGVPRGETPVPSFGPRTGACWSPASAMTFTGSAAAAIRQDGASRPIFRLCRTTDALRFGAARAAPEEFPGSTDGQQSVSVCERGGWFADGRTSLDEVRDTVQREQVRHGIGLLHIRGFPHATNDAAREPLLGWRMPSDV